MWLCFPAPEPFSYRFNGAAIDRSRKCAAPRSCASKEPRFNGAAIDRSRKYHGRLEPARRFASMGPRSIDRGNDGKIDVISRNALLQWGRDRSIAEMVMCAH